MKPVRTIVLSMILATCGLVYGTPGADDDKAAAAKAAAEQARAAQEAAKNKAEQAAAKREQAMLAAEKAAVEQAEGTAGHDWVMKVIPVRYADVDKLAAALSVFGGQIKGNRDMKIITVSARKDLAAVAEEAIARLDVPPPIRPSILLTIYVVHASKQPGESDSLPAELGPVVKQLGQVLSIKKFSLDEIVIMRARDGSRGTTDGILRGWGPEGTQVPYHLRFAEARLVSDETGRTVQLDRFGMELRVPIVVRSGAAQNVTESIQHESAGIETDIALREGQLAVIGKATIDGSADSLILIVNAQVVQ